MAVLTDVATKLDDVSNDLRALDFEQEKEGMAEFLSSLSDAVGAVAGALQNLTAVFARATAAEAAPAEEAPAE